MEIQANQLQFEKDQAKETLAHPEKALPALVFSKTGRIVCMLTRRKVELPWLYNLAVLALLVQLPTLITANLFKETTQWAALGLIWMGYIELGLFATMIAHVGLFYLYENVKKHVLNKIQREEDLRDLQQVLARARSNKLSIYFILGFTLFWSISFSLVTSLYIKQFIGYGLFVGTIIFGLLVAPALYMECWLFYFIIHIGTYHYDLNETAPAHSEVIVFLSRVFTTLLYSFAVFIAFATFAVAFNTGAVLLVILIGWIPTVVFFFGSQRSLGRIIRSAKWKTLDHIQEKIRTLNKGDITCKENIEAINRLMDYHEKIRITPDSTLNIGTGFNLFNQLALPLTGLLLANIERILQFFR